MSATKPRKHDDISDRVLVIKNVTINNRGQIVIPKIIRDRLQLETGNVLQVALLANRAIIIRKILEIPISTFLEENKDILKLVLESYEEAKKGNLAHESSFDSDFKKKS